MSRKKYILMRSASEKFINYSFFYDFTGIKYIFHAQKHIFETNNVENVIFEIIAFISIFHPSRAVKAVWILLLMQMQLFGCLNFINFPSDLF